jgi:hypothetical protein
LAISQRPSIAVASSLKVLADSLAVLQFQLDAFRHY